MTVEELVSDPDRRHRLALRIIPPDVPPAVGEALVLQLASVTPPGSRLVMSPLHVGVGITGGYPTGHTFSVLQSVFESVGTVLAGEVTDRESMIGAVVDGDVHHGHLMDQNGRVTVLSAAEFVSDRLQVAVERAMATGTVPLDASYQADTLSCNEPITVAGSVDSETAVDEQLPVSNGLASCFDLVTLADSTATDTWLIPPTDQSVSDVSADVAVEYLRRVQQTDPEIEDAAHEHLKVYRDNLLFSTDPQAESEYVPTPLAVGQSVGGISIAIARLELAEKVTADHLEAAIRLYDASLQYRSYTVKSPAYWRDCAGEPAYSE